MTKRAALHLAIPVDDLDAARTFYGGVLGLSEGRSTDRWIDWDLGGNQLVTHAVPTAVASPAATSLVDGHEVPVPHFGALLDTAHFHELARRLRGASVAFVIEPTLRYAGEPAEQWTMFFHDPAANALEFKAFRDPRMAFAT